VLSQGRFRYLEALPSGGTRQKGTLVLIHAFPLSARMWEPQLSLARRGWRVIAPFLRGMDGGSSDPPSTSIDDFAADIIDLLDLLHIDRAVIGGLSLGGYVTLALLRLAPSYFSGIVLADTRAEADSPDAIQGRQRMLDLVRTAGPTAVAEQMLPRLLGESTRRDHPEIVEQVRGFILSNTAEGIAGAVTAMMGRPDSTAQLGTIRWPTLVMVGDEDVLTPPKVSEGLSRAIPGATLVRIPGAGHLSNLEQPDAFSAALAGFLDHRL
jgi:pimeloyl-ACP methyl ester carboxylesterase